MGDRLWLERDTSSAYMDGRSRYHVRRVGRPGVLATFLTTCEHADLIAAALMADHVSTTSRDTLAKAPAERPRGLSPVLLAAGRVRLAEALRKGNAPHDWRAWDQLQPEEREPYLSMVDYAVDSGKVRVVDPGLRERAAKAIYRVRFDGRSWPNTRFRDLCVRDADAVIGAVFGDQ